MGKGKILIVASILGSIMSFLYARDAHAQKFLTKPIEFVCHAAAGGGSDIFARVVQSIIEKEKLTSHPIAVVNRAGGNGAIAFGYVAQRKGDPHYWLTATSSFLVTPQITKSKNNYKDFTALANLAYDDFLVVVRADSPHKSMKDLIEAAKKNPGEIRMGGAYAPGTDAVIGHLIQKETGIKFNYIPFKSGGEFLVALLGGHIEVAIPNPGEALPQVEAKKLRALCVTSQKRMEQLPEIPTLKELGYNVAFQQLRSIAAPKDLPGEAVKYYEDLFKRLANSKTWKEKYIRENILTWDYKTSSETFKMWEEENENFNKILKEMGVVK